jgi:hypothetical protein
LQARVVGDDFAVTHLLGAITPVFDGPADQRWWYVEVGDDAATSRGSIGAPCRPRLPDPS